MSIVRPFYFEGIPNNELQLELLQRAIIRTTSVITQARAAYAVHALQCDDDLALESAMKAKLEAQQAELARQTARRSEIK